MGADVPMNPSFFRVFAPALDKRRHPAFPRQRTVASVSGDGFPDMTFY
jgi:hypothetical protein